ncbi:MAG TPA: universal stress protein [Cyclobacteriaceae bacterium]|jgi:nucleotide-binding universal stress UspA family protein
MEEKILCPIDFSESSIKALKYAIKLAKKEHLGVTVLFSYRLIQPGRGEEILSFRDKMEEAARERFDVLEKFFDNGVKTDHEFLVEIGFFSDCIARQVRNKKVRKIVIDNHMHEIINDLNQPPESFLNSLPVPVIVIGDEE